jgi:hypothetical protein
MNDYANIVQPIGATATLRFPTYTWQWCLNGDWRAITVSVEKAPCWFYRFTQRAILGIHWRKIP